MRGCHHQESLAESPVFLYEIYPLSEFAGQLIVSIDPEGRNLFEENKVIFIQRKEKAIEKICKYVGFIK